MKRVKFLYRIFIDGAIERGGSTKESDLVDPRAKPKFIKDVLAQTGGNALLPCQFHSPGIVSIYNRQYANMYV